jgi:hypothetical protein
MLLTPTTAPMPKINTEKKAAPIPIRNLLLMGYLRIANEVSSIFDKSKVTPYI